MNLPIALTDVEISNLKPMEEARCAGSGALIGGMIFFMQQSF